MTNLEAYVEQMEKTNSSPCYVKTETLRQLLNVVEAAKNMVGDKSIELKLALKRLDEARQG